MIIIAVSPRSCFELRHRKMMVAILVWIHATLIVKKTAAKRMDVDRLPFE